LFKYGDEIGDVYKVTKKGLSKVDDYVDVIKKALSKSGDDVAKGEGKLVRIY